MSQEKPAFVAAMAELESKWLALLEEHKPDLNGRWMAISRTHVEEGKMAAVKAFYEESNKRQKLAETTQTQ